MGLTNGPLSKLVELLDTQVWGPFSRSCWRFLGNRGPPGKGDSYWKPSFLGAMLVLGSVPRPDYFPFFDGEMFESYCQLLQ